MTDFSQPTPQNQDPSVNLEQTAPFTPEPLPEPPLLPFTIKADLSEYRKRVGVWRVLIAVIFLAIVFFRFGPIAGTISVVTVGLTIAIILFVLSRRSIVLDVNEVKIYGFFGKTKEFKYEDISSVKVFLAYIEPAFGHTPRIIAGKKGGGAFFTLLTLYWKSTDIDLLLATMNAKSVANETYTEPAVSAMVAKQFPDYVAAYEKHPYLIAFGIVIAIVVIVTIFVILTM